jgi:hypothetical protein
MARRRRTPGFRRSGRTGAVLLSLAVLVCTPATVVVLASRDTAAAPTVVDQPASRDPLRPATPFFAGQGVRPDGVGCRSPDGTAVRGRAHLDVFADGRRVTVPAGIGVLDGCRYWLHTTAADGVVQIASPERRAFTLGDLFDIWGAPLARDGALGLPGRLRAFAGGRRVSGDPRRIALRDGQEIALVIGRSPARVPREFTFR